jgi:multisubunit Na+/H+ antiporter MnhC subunit
MLVLAAIVVCAAVIMLFANRHNRTSGHLPSGQIATLSLIDISDLGLRCRATMGGSIDDNDELLPWSSVIEVVVINRNELFRKWFGFELMIEGHGLLVIDGSSSDGRAFLSQVYHLVGFDHAGLLEALRRRHPRTVCYSG